MEKVEVDQNTMKNGVVVEPESSLSLSTRMKISTYSYVQIPCAIGKKVMECLPEENVEVVPHDEKLGDQRLSVVYELSEGTP